MENLKYLNQGIRFILELCMLAAVGYWGFSSGENLATNILLGLGIPLCFALIWGMLLAPKSARRLVDPWFSILELLLFGLAAGALWNSGKTDLSYIFSATYILHKIGWMTWKQY